MNRGLIIIITIMIAIPIAIVVVVVLLLVSVRQTFYCRGKSTTPWTQLRLSPFAPAIPKRYVVVIFIFISISLLFALETCVLV